MADGFLGRPQDGLPTALIAEPPLSSDPQLPDRPTRQQHRPVDREIKPKFGKQNRRPWKFQGPRILHFRGHELHVDDFVIVDQVLAQLDGRKIAQAHGAQGYSGFGVSLAISIHRI